MKKNTILILAAVLLVTAGLSDLFTFHEPNAVYNAELIEESKPDQAYNEPDPDAPLPDEEHSEPALDDLESNTPQDTGESAPEPEKNEVAQNLEINVDFIEEALLEAGEEPEAESEPESEEAAPVPLSGKLRVDYTVLSAHEALVTSYTALQSALANDNGITTVYFGNDITLQGGVKIHPSKAHIIVDGRNPLEAGRPQPYTLTDIDSVSFFETIHVDLDAPSIKSIYVRDLIIVGKNYYGPFSVYNAPGLDGFTITYERVNYNGPQLCYNRRGTSRFIDCSVKIHGGNGTWSPSQEFAESRHMVFSGTNTIDTATSDYSIFWHPYGGTFEISDDSALTLTSPNTSTIFGMFFADAPANNVSVSIGNHAVFDASIAAMVASEIYVTLNSFTVGEGGAFNLTTTKTATATVLRIGGNLTVQKDAKFIIKGHGGALFNVLRQENGDITVGKDAVFQIISSQPYTPLINLVGSAFVCDDPASVLLYNANRDIQASTSAGRISASSQQINYWNAPSSNGFDNPPLYQWRKSDETNLVINGTLSIGAGGNFSGFSSNHDPTIDPPNTPLNPTTFNMSAARVLALGRLELIVAKPTVKSADISGVTAPNADVRVSFTQQGTNYTLPDVKADSDGEFHVPVEPPLQEGAVIQVKSNWNYLTTSAYTTVAAEGKLEFFIPGVLQFYTTHLSPSKKVIKRLNPDWKVVASDSRGDGGQWAVYARPGSKIVPASAGLPALSGALVFVDDTGNATTMDAGADTLILRHTTALGEDVFPIIWDDDKGILLSIEPGAVFADTLYTATIFWTFVDGV